MGVVPKVLLGLKCRSRIKIYVKVQKVKHQVLYTSGLDSGHISPGSTILNNVIPGSDPREIRLLGLVILPRPYRESEPTFIVVFLFCYNYCRRLWMNK